LSIVLPGCMPILKQVETRFPTGYAIPFYLLFTDYRRVMRRSSQI
jgi:hypothetical protein